MVDLDNIRKFTVPCPEGWNLFGNADAFETLPETHKDQILFLDKAAANYIFEFSEAAHLTTGGFWDPFEKGNFKYVEEYGDFSGSGESRQRLNKWLYHRGIAFRTWVFVLSNNDHPVLTTWKMVIKYSDTIFGIDDVMIFDQTLNWCLIFFHEDRMFFGKDNVYNPAEDEKRMEELNERKRKYPLFRHPYL